MKDSRFRRPIAGRRWRCAVAVLIAAAILGHACCGSGAESGALDWPRAETHAAAENARLAARPQGAGRARFVICTLYYTPRETGFTAERGFDVTPETRPGLGGRRFGRDFLRAVQREGFGRLAQPVAGAGYLHYEGGGRYGFAARPTGRDGVPLVPRRSCAARGGLLANAGGLAVGSAWAIEAAGWPDVLPSDTRWRVMDTGAALRRWQVDLYWGEDDPHSPGAGIARPRGTGFQWTFARARRVDK